VLLYIIGCAAAVKLRRDGIALAGTPVRIPALGLVAALGAIAMVWVGVQSTREEAVGITIFIAVASLLYAFRRLPVPATA
jgi:APA family basic amino acid/polyamine antiporter